VVPALLELQPLHDLVVAGLARRQPLLGLAPHGMGGVEALHPLGQLLAVVGRLQQLALDLPVGVDALHAHHRGRRKLTHGVTRPHLGQDLTLLLGQERSLAGEASVALIAVDQALDLDLLGHRDLELVVAAAEAVGLLHPGAVLEHLGALDRLLVDEEVDVVVGRH